MSHDYGPIETYEVVWKSGHVERVQGYQVLFESCGFMPAENPRFMIHGMFNGHWRLVLTAPETEIHTIRLVTADERLTP